MTMCKTAALKAASKSVTQINCGRDYVFYVDRDVKNPNGPSMEVRSSGYSAASLKRSVWLAINALEFMGKLDSESQYAVHAESEDPYTTHTAAAMLQAGIDKFNTGATAEEITACADEYWNRQLSV